MTHSTIQHSGNSVYAVLTDEGPAIYPSLRDAVAAVRYGLVEVSAGDREYYERQAERSPWHPVRRDDLAEAGL